MKRKPLTPAQRHARDSVPWGRWPPERVLYAVRAWTQAHGRSPKRADFCTAEGLPSSTALYRAFPSLPALRVLAGVPAVRRQPRSFAAAVQAYLEREAQACDTRIG